MSSGPLQTSAGYEGKADLSVHGEAHGRALAVRREVILLALWLVANIGIGILTVRQYGVSFDEPNNYRYAADTLSAYKTWFGLAGNIPYNASYDGHGPAFMAAMLLLIRGIQSIFPSVFQPDLFHLSYFIAFQLAGVCLYLLMRRWFQPWTAWGILILFDTQPLLLGHAFINPKDIPFMLFFTLSILLGFRMADSVQAGEPFVSLEASFQTLGAKLQNTDRSRRRRFFLLLGTALVVAFALLLFSGLINNWVGQTARSFYRAAPDSWQGRVFSVFATHAAGLTAKDYMSKAQSIFQQAEGIVGLAALLFFLVYFGVTFPAVWHSVWAEIGKLPATRAEFAARLRSTLNPHSLKSFLAAVWVNLRQPRVLIAGVVLGLATSVRAVAPWAGVIACLYLLSKARPKAWATGVAYFLIAGIVGYLTWPRLWGAPLQRYWAGIHTISNFVDAQHVLFNGHVYPATGLPGSYIFTLLNIQLTETFLACAYIGIAILAWQLLRNRVHTDLLLYVLLGFAAPIIGWQVTRSPLYDNLRQLLFLMPAMFVLAAFTLEWLFQMLTRSWVRVLLIAAIALPGLYSSVRLYPYQYNYYNSLIGGVAGARKLYTMDPWRTSLRELALALNQKAPSGARVLSGGWTEIMSLYTRPDIALEANYDESADVRGEYDFTVEVPNVKPWKLHHETQDAYTVVGGGVALGTLLAINNAVAK